MSTLERLQIRSHEDENGCWIWGGSINSGGYGSISIDSVLQKTHRVSWAIHNGPIPDGMKVLHKCDNPSCWKPDHLFLGTQQDNVDDMIAKGRYRGANRGAANGRAILTEQEVVEIQEWIRYSNWLYKDIAERYGVSPSTISNINNRNWNHVPIN